MTNAEPAPAHAGRNRAFCCHMATLSGRHAPNSLAAVRECVEAGVSRFEIDVQFLVDGTPVVFHDDDLAPTTNSSGRVAELDRRQLARARYIRGDQPVATLDEVVEAAAGRRSLLQVDLKPLARPDMGRVERLAAALEPVSATALVGSQSLSTLEALAPFGLRLGFDPWREWHRWPGRPEGETVPRQLGLHGLWDDSPTALVPGLAPAEYARRRIDETAALAPWASEWMVEKWTVLHFDALGVALGRELADRGVELAAWTVATDEGAETDRLVGRLFEVGVSTVITDVAAALGPRFPLVTGL